MSARQSSVRSSERFAARRRLRRRRVLIGSGIFGVIAVAVVIYGLNQPYVRVTRIQIFGGDASLAGVVERAMEGRYLGIIPRDSTFFFPSSRIRADIVAADPQVAAVALFRSGFTGLSVRVDSRAPVAAWCGSTGSARAVPEAQCYVFDASGVIYAPYATSTEPMNKFALYAPLVADNSEPLHATIADADKLPAAFDFARELSSLGSIVVSVALTGDEVIDALESGTRVRYVLGDEQNAFTALTSAKETLNLANGSLDYVDLRFEGRVYAKKKSLGGGPNASTSATVSE